MSQVVDRLAPIAAKGPVVATHIGAFTETNTPQTYERYNREALTYVCPPEIADFQQQMLDKILRQGTAIGCIVAPFGYGKTSAAIATWKLCEAKGVLALPPFSCGSIGELGQAMASGVIERLGPDHAVKIQKAHDTLIVSSAQRLAQQDSEQYQINFETALRSIEDKIERGILQVEAMSNHLLIFIEQLTQIVVDAGYKGFLVIVDEFQQFLGNINKTTITNFRTLVWGLRTRGSVPFGFLITLDPDTERNLNERAGDIMHRIKEDGLYLDFTDAYDREFPRLLWTRYAEILGFTDYSQQIVDYATLDAIGQIGERHDLSNGPRTVIDVFQHIANTYATKQQPYSPMDLINDFMTGAIRFDGDQSKIASLVTELTSYDYIKRAPKRFETLKLIAAFPRGCPREVSERYNLADSYDELADLLRGEILTELPEGIALIDLQKVGKPQNKLNIILKKYWLHITEDEIVADKAVRLFAKYALEPLFPPSHNLISGWSSEDADFQLTPNGSYSRTYEGTFFEEYPKRRVYLQVCHSLDQAYPSDQFADVSFTFVLQRLNADPIAPAYDPTSRTFTLSLPINRPFDLPIPRDVRWIEEYLRPVVISPGVLLSLLDYIESHAPTIEGITTSEMARIEAHQQKLQTFLLTAVFGENLFQGLGLNVLARGEQSIREVLFSVLRSAYPTYRTLITSPQWETVLKAYAKALGLVGALHSRGIEPLSDAKSFIAAIFGFRNHAGFESQSKQYEDLLSIEKWTGDSGSVRFQRHPGETILHNAIILDSLDRGRLTQIGRRDGYLPEEVSWLAEFLVLRGFIQFDEETQTYIPTHTLSSPELEQLAFEIREESELLRLVVDTPSLRQVLEQVARAVTNLKTGELTDVQLLLLQAQNTVQQERPRIAKQLSSQLLSLRSTIHQHIDALKRSLPISNTGSPLDTHINGVGRILANRREVYAESLNRFSISINYALNQPSLADDARSLYKLIDASNAIFGEYNALAQTVEDILGLSSRHLDWIKLVQRLQQVAKYNEVLDTLADTTGFEREHITITQELMEALSVDGLQRYQTLFEAYWSRVLALLDEVSTAIKAQQIAQAKTEPKPSTVSQQSARSKKHPKNLDPILKLIEVADVSFAQVVDALNLTAEELQKRLIELEMQGQITVLITKGNKKQ
ncbi:hypothetical protein FBQ95_10325 [Chloroflexi bacterium CFX3]|nr:hypothetical protein [Chloroflexi bacterium CFX3]